MNYVNSNQPELNKRDELYLENTEGKRKRQKQINISPPPTVVKKYNRIAEIEKELFNDTEVENRKGTWSNEEDKILLDWVQKHGPVKWTECSKRISGRCGKQCRERWVNILNPDVKKGNWSDFEQREIFEGLKKAYSSWSYLAKSIPGRTENSIKNYFYSSIRRIKSNVIFNDLRQVFLGRISSAELKRTREEAINKELQKMNLFCLLITKYLIWESTDGDSFREFLTSILFSDITNNDSVKQKIGSNYNKDVNPNQVTPNRFINHVNSPPNNNRRVSPISPYKTESIIGILKNLANETSMNKFVPILKYLESQIGESQIINENGKMTIKIPKCWNCSNDICMLHKVEGIDSSKEMEEVKSEYLNNQNN